MCVYVYVCVSVRMCVCVCVYVCICVCVCHVGVCGPGRYCRERTSMRALSGTKEPALLADPIIHHPSVRTMLLTMKAYAEGGKRGPKQRYLSSFFFAFIPCFLFFFSLFFLLFFFPRRLSLLNASNLSFPLRRALHGVRVRQARGPNGAQCTTQGKRGDKKRRKKRNRAESLK